MGRHRAPRELPALLIPLRGRDFRLLWTGMSTSLIGDGILLVALAWQVYALSGAPAAMSVVGFALSLPQVVTLLFGGVVSDRFDRRKIMLGTDLVRGAVLTVLAALSLTGGLQLWHVVGLVAVYGAASGFFGPAFDSLVPQIVPAKDLVQANALDQFVRPAAMQMAGPSLGGILIAVGGSGLAFAVDAVTFAVSALCLLLMRSVPSIPEDEPSSVWADFKEGMSFVRRNVWLWGTFVAATFAYLLFIGPTEVLLPFVVKNELHGTAGDLGLVLASGGIGAIAAALVVGQRGVPRQYMVFIYLTWTLATLAVAGYGVATASWHLAIACALVNGLEAAGTIAWATAKQRLVPEELMGRVSSVDWFISIALVPLSYALAAPVATAIGVRETLIGAGVLGAAVTLAFLYLPGMRTPRGLTTRSA
ncbi:MFS transporter [Dactylosporangium sucinum]|uniref:Tetracycline efflux MFS transporter Tet(V) n=1 Tax=Dactylosporangium sucinum TaxID=1424081 RepID=A0A917X6U8_9ACTN|nr:MFS transporter [Dactylosporangium sucinum]GGM81895.1 tetracycline efflux MFS transporter Tet(V) [Dactylosporangium sucinum]